MTFLSRLFLLLLLPFTLLFSSEALAQTTGTIKGVTVDDGGMAVPGVVITITSPALIGGAQQQETDAEGRFLFVKLPPGIYNLQAERAGFAPKQYQDLQVLIGRTVTLTVEMSLQEAGMEMEVVAEKPLIDTEQTQKSMVLTQEFLEKVPTGRDYLTAVSAAPGVLGTGNANMGGAAYNENTYMIDGVNITDPVTGTFSLNFNFDAIEQIEVVTGAFDAEHATNLGGIVNIVTETGGNVLEFETNVYYTNGNWSPKWDARYAADGLQLAPTDFDSTFSSYTVSAKISGPIVRDRAWFIVSYSGARSLISNVGIDLPRDYEGHYVLAKITAQPNASHRFTTLAQANPTTVDNIDQSSLYIRPEAQGRQTQGGVVLSEQWDYFISPEVFIESKATFQKSFIESSSVPCTHNKKTGYSPCDPDELENTVDFYTPGRLGSNNAYDSVNYPFFQFDDRFRYRVESKASFLQRTVPVLNGSHDFKVGGEIDAIRTNRVVGYNGNTMYVDVNEQAYDPATYKNYYWYEITGAFAYTQTGEHYGAFVQDVYKPVDNLTFRYGIRYDRSVLRSDQAEAVVNVGVWGPRFYATWDPWGDEKTKLLAGYGRFNGIGNLGVAYDLNASTFGSKMYLGEALIGYQGASGYQNSSSDTYDLQPAANSNTALDGLTAPHSDEFTIGGERQVIEDVLVGTRFTGKFTKNVYEFDETNIIWDQDGYSFIGTGNGVIESLFRLRTPDVARRDYYQTDVYLTKADSNRWGAQLNYSYVVSKGTVLTSSTGGLAVPPQVELAYGNLGTDVRHQFKGYAYWDLPNDPWTTTLGMQLQAYSGYPVTRYYYSAGYGAYALLKDPLGTYARSEPEVYIDIQVRQAFDVRKGQFIAVAILENAINARQPDNVDFGWVAFQNRWVISSRQNPMQFTLGLEYRY